VFEGGTGKPGPTEFRFDQGRSASRKSKSGLAVGFCGTFLKKYLPLNLKAGKRQFPIPPVIKSPVSKKVVAGRENGGHDDVILQTYHPDGVKPQIYSN